MIQRPPRTIHEVNELPVEWRRALYRIAIPSQLLAKFGIHPIRLTDRDGACRVTFQDSAQSSVFQLRVDHEPEAVDPLYLLQLQDSAHGSIVVAFLATNDPFSERYDIDHDEEGRPTLLGTVRRNRGEEERAMNAGLAPGQVRQGLRLLDHVMARVEALLVALGQDTVIIEPLAYHNAVLFERHGFAYVQGQREMQRIQAGFQAGGILAERLDGSSPFRQPEAANSIRGRSWAIHDGILGRTWEGVRMIKRLGSLTASETAPGCPW